MAETEEIYHTLVVAQSCRDCGGDMTMEFFYTTKPTLEDFRFIYDQVSGMGCVRFTIFEYKDGEYQLKSETP